MTRAHSFAIGSFQCHALEAGTQRLDGGAMFGVVPRPLWQTRISPDERNRIPLALRCLLIEHPEGLILIDTGIGNKEDSRFQEIYGVENEQGSALEAAITEVGFSTADITMVINTHLHFDHAGGNTRFQEPGRPESLAITFPQARYVVQGRELEFARKTNERTRASYLPPNFEPIAERGLWGLIDGPARIAPGITAHPTPGHVPFHQSILIESEGEKLLYLADVIPTAHHLPLPWIMGYDLEPLATLESKRTLLTTAASEGWTLFFEHDPRIIMGKVTGGVGGKGVELVEMITVAG